MLSRLAIRAMVMLILLAGLLAFAVVAAAARLPYSGELAYVSYSGINPDIYLIDVTRGFSFNLTRHPAYDAEPVWSPDGTRIAFVSNRDGILGIYTMSADGRDPRVISDGEHMYRRPRWSTDGSRIVFISGVPGREQAIYSASAEGGDMEQIDYNQPRSAIQMDISAEQYSVGSRVSPDGSYTLNVRFDGKWQVLIADRETRQASRAVPMGWYYKEPPVWSPDGAQFAYVAYTTRSTSEVYIHDLATAQLRRLTDHHSEVSSLAWRP